jgi:predicted phosphohydrolase
MSLFALGDTHLSLGTNKQMDVFSGWNDYVPRLEKNWRAVVGDDDTVVIAGDISWEMNLNDTFADFRFLDSLPGTKIIMKGNHDYWWETKTKMERFFSDNSLESIKILFNNAYEAGDFCVCGTRGWFFDDESDAQAKLISREVGRLNLSLDAAEKTGKEPIVFLHYPPLSNNAKCDEIYDTLVRRGVKRCFYAHLHGEAHRYAFQGKSDGITFSLISGDYLKFCPKLIEKY